MHLITRYQYTYLIHDNNVVLIPMELSTATMMAIAQMMPIYRVMNYIRCNLKQYYLLSQ